MGPGFPVPEAARFVWVGRCSRWWLFPHLNVGTCSVEEHFSAFSAEPRKGVESGFQCLSL